MNNVIDKLISEIEKTNIKAKKVKDSIDTLNNSVSELSRSFSYLGKSMANVIPLASKAENSISASLQMYKGVFPIKDISRIYIVRREYQELNKVHLELSAKLQSMISHQNNEALKDRIELQKKRVYESTKKLNTFTVKSKLELEQIRNEQDKLVRSNTIMLLESQKNMFGSCLGSTQTFEIHIRK